MMRCIIFLSILALFTACAGKQEIFYVHDEPALSKAVLYGSYGDGIHDDTETIRSAVASTPEGGFLSLGSGRYLLSGPLNITRHISLLGYGAQLIATTKDDILDFRNVGGRIFGVEFIGANLSDASGNGLAVQFYGDSTMTESPSIDIQNCRFSNFKGDYWIDVRNASLVHEFSGVNISDNYFVSLPGNARDGSSLGVPTAAISVQGSTAGAIVRNIIISRNSFDWSYSKECVALWAGARDAVVSNNIMRNVGIDSSIGNDKGAYAILVYDSTFLNVPRGITISDNVIDGVKSCGIYCAGAKELTITGNTISGQTDPLDGTLPKGGICLNGCSAATISGNTVRSCVSNGITSINDLNYAARSLVVSDNTVNTADNGIVISTAWGADKSVSVTSNYVTGTIRGISIRSFSPGSLSELLVEGNSIHSSSFGVACWSYDGSHLSTSGAIKNNYAFSCWMPVDAPSVPALIVSGNYP